MSYFLDTDICMYALKGLHPAIERNLRGLLPSEIKIPSIVKAELLYGAEKCRHPIRLDEVNVEGRKFDKGHPTGRIYNL